MRIPFNQLAGHSAWSAELFALCWMFVLGGLVALFWDTCRKEWTDETGLRPHARRKFWPIDVPAAIAFVGGFFGAAGLWEHSIGYHLPGVSANRQSHYEFKVVELAAGYTGLTVAAILLLASIGTIRKVYQYNRSYGRLLKKRLITSAVMSGFALVLVALAVTFPY